MYFIKINFEEYTERSFGRTTDFSLMYSFSDRQAVWYSIAYLIPATGLLIAGIYSIYRMQRKRVIAISVFIVVLFLLQILTDRFFWEPQG